MTCFYESIKEYGLILFWFCDLFDSEKLSNE